MLSLRIVVIAVCLTFLAAVALQVRRGRLLLRYSLLWMALAVVAMLGALFPEIIFRLSDLVGFETPSNFILFVGLFFLMAVCLSLSVIVSKQALRIKSLVQEMAIMENESEK